jgi:hypothetical protein
MGFFLLAARSYEADLRQLESVRLELQAPAPPSLERKALA